MDYSLDSLNLNVRHLNQYQANALVAHLNYKKYHYNVQGLLFDPMHDLFERFAVEAYDRIDEIAERALIIGGQAVNDLEEHLSLSTLISSKGDKDLNGMLKEAYINTRRLIEELLEFEQVSSDLGDVGTSDLFIRHVQMWEKQAWFLRKIMSSSPSSENGNSSQLSGRSD
jgi:starvation-inducible DNA-binding protein